MADKNLHDIKIDELDSPKKTPLKNILTLLALLFIILVISVVITKLILNTDKSPSIENNSSQTELLNNTQDDNKSVDITGKKDEEKKDEESKENIKTSTSTITEPNLTSVIKAPLTSHQPKKNNVEMTTYKAPKHTSNTVRRDTTPKKSTPAKVITHSTPKKQYIDKVVVRKSTTSSIKSASFLGGKRKDVSNSYYIKVGTYRDPSSILKKVKKNNFNYSIVKVENDKTLLRVLVGPFFSRNQANSQLAKVKANILTGAYVTKAK